MLGNLHLLWTEPPAALPSTRARARRHPLPGRSSRLAEPATAELPVALTSALALPSESAAAELRVALASKPAAAELRLMLASEPAAAELRGALAPDLAAAELRLVLAEPAAAEQAPATTEPWPTE
jgi:hypothetical protein